MTVPTELRSDVETLWGYHNMGHTMRPCDAGIGLGSHDLGVAAGAVELFNRGMFKHLVFTGANAPTTIERFPQGEAVAYRDYAIQNGVPAAAIMVDNTATNTEQNIRNSRALLDEAGIRVGSIVLMSRPYQQRRAFATCKMLWPQVDVVCYSNPLPLDEYVASIGDTGKVINMLVGDTQRIEVYADKGYAIPQPMPESVRQAFARLVKAGYTSRLV